MRTRVDSVPSNAIDRGTLEDAMAHDAMVDAFLGAPTPIDAAVDLGMTPDDFGVADTETAPDGFVDDCPFEVVASHPRASRRFEPIVDGDTVYISHRDPDGLLRYIRADDSTPVNALGGEIISARDGAVLLMRSISPGQLGMFYVDADGEHLLQDRFSRLVGGPDLPSRPDWRALQWVQPGGALYPDGGELGLWQNGEPVDIEYGPERIEGWWAEMALSGGVVGQARFLNTHPTTYDVWLGDRQVLGPDRDWRRGTMRATDDGLWVGLGHRVHYVPLDGGPTQSWGREGYTVRAIEVSDGLAIAVLRDAEGHDSVWTLPLGDAPVVQGGVIAARLAGDVLVVARWGRPNNWCGQHQGGELFWGPIGAPGRSLGLLNSGCDCCDRGMVTPVLSVSETTLAWSTGNMVGDPASARVQIARRRCR